MVAFVESQFGSIVWRAQLSGELPPHKQLVQCGIPSLTPNQPNEGVFTGGWLVPVCGSLSFAFVNSCDRRREAGAQCLEGLLGG